MKLPPATEIQHLVSELKSTVATSTVDISNYQEILQQVRDKLGATSVASQERDFEQWYFRARVDVKHPENPAEYSLPPTNSSVSLGRCNLPHHPVFYGGEHPGIALKEIGATSGDLAYLSLWRSRDAYPTYAMFGFTDNVNTPRLKTHKEFRIALLRQSMERQHHDEQEINAFVQLQKAMADLFTCQGKAISATLSHHAIYDKGFDGVEYPDAKTLLTYNFALSPKFAKKLELHRVWECRATNDIYSVDFCRVGILNSGSVDWKPISSENELPSNLKDAPWSNILGDDWQTSLMKR